MNTFSKFVLTAVVVLALGMMMLMACGKSSSDTAGLVISTPTTTTEGKQAASGATQGASLGGGSAETFGNLGSIGMDAAMNGDGGAPAFKIPSVPTKDAGLSKASKLSARLAKSKAVARTVAAFRKAKALAPVSGNWTYNDDCGHAGSISATGTASGDDDPSNMHLTLSLTVIADNCQEDNSKIDGSIKVDASVSLTSSGTSTTISLDIKQEIGTAADKFTIVEYSSGSSYLVVDSQLEADITLGMNGQVSQSGGQESGEIGFTANGTLDVNDQQETFDLSYSNFGISVNIKPASGGVLTEEMTVNGGFSESWTDDSQTPSVAKSVNASFVSYALSIATNKTTNATDMTISGGFSIDYTPNECFEGGYAFETITPIHTNSSGMTTAGEVLLNGVVTIEFNSDGTITATMDGVTIYDGDQNGLATVCEFETLEGGS